MNKVINAKVIYQIIQKTDDGFFTKGAIVGSYSRAYHDEVEFRSIEDARNANCHGEFLDKEKYAIRKVLVTYTVLEEEAGS